MGDLTAVNDMDRKNYGSSSPILFPPGLDSGSTVAITAPASPVSAGQIQPAVRFFKSMGLKVEVGNTISKVDFKNKYFSAPDEERAEELMSFAKRSDVSCIMTGRGGYGVMRILPMLDFEEFKRKPKIVIGFSDITALLLAINKKSNMITFHGPVASSQMNSFQSDFIKKLLFRTKSFEPVVIKDRSAIVLSEGTAQGKLIGGNLSIFSSTVGTPFEPNTDGAILFLEETREEPYKLDRMLTQMKLAGKFDNLRGVAFGCMNKIDTRKNFFPGRSYTVREIIMSFFGDLKIPVVSGLPFGHDKYNATLPIGAMAELNAKDQSLTILQAAVS
jgi:muramoyltetrapeptide carboxypeptidase